MDFEHAEGVNHKKECHKKRITPKVESIEDAEQRRFDFMHQLREKQCQNRATVEAMELQRYKYFLFLTVKQNILKQIKDEKLDDRILVLRTQKFVKFYCTN